MWSIWWVFYDCDFHSVLPLIRIRGLWKFAAGRDWLWGKLGLVLMGRVLFNKSVIQFSLGGQGCSVQFSPSVMSDSLRPNNWSTPGLAVHHQLPDFTQTHVIESVMPSSHLIFCRPLLLLPPIAPGQPFAWRGQSTGVSALASFLPKKSQGWSPSEWTSWISLQSKGFPGAFSNTTVQKHQFSGTQLSSQSNSRTHTWPLEKP